MIIISSKDKAWYKVEDLNPCANTEEKDASCMSGGMESWAVSDMEDSVAFMDIRNIDYRGKDVS